MRTAAVAALDANLGAQWRVAVDDAPGLADEAKACSLALGFSA